MRQDRIEVACPVCEHRQVEPAEVLSTICSNCGTCYEIVSPRNGSLRDFMRKTFRHWRQRFRPDPPEYRWITCFTCGQANRVSHRAFSTGCSRCGSYIRLEGILVDTVFSREILTRGWVRILPEGQLKSTRVVCHNLDLQGYASSDFNCSAAFHVFAGGRAGGVIRCGELILEEGSSIDDVRLAEAYYLYIDSRVIGQDLRARKVRVGPHGHLSGSVQAESFTVDDGGQFDGQLTIAPMLHSGDMPVAQSSEEGPPLMLRAPHVDTRQILRDFEEERLAAEKRRLGRTDPFEDAETEEEFFRYRS